MSALVEDAGFCESELDDNGREVSGLLFGSERVYWGPWGRFIIVYRIGRGDVEMRETGVALVGLDSWICVAWTERVGGDPVAAGVIFWYLLGAFVFFVHAEFAGARHYDGGIIES